MLHIACLCCIWTDITLYYEVKAWIRLVHDTETFHVSLLPRFNGDSLW